MKMNNTKLLSAFFILCFTALSLSSVSCARESYNDLVLWHDFPATDWQSHAFPIGNGTMGVMSFGGIAMERLQFNVDSLWTGDENPDGRYETEGMGAYQNFGDVFKNTGNNAEFVHDGIEFDGSNGSPIERGKQNPTQGVSNGDAISSFQGFANKFSVCRCTGDLNLFRLDHLLPIQVHQFI